jgi:NhaA family Na+:H+ antiporter
MPSPTEPQDLPSPATFLRSNRFLARRFAQPLAAFLHVEAAGGILLVVAAIAALLWANLASDSYHTFWETVIELRIGSFTLAEPLEAWVADGLMALFFFVVGLEIKRELVTGELRDPRTAALPAVAALGGMVVPAAIYLAFNAGGDGMDGWGIPMATDIAFALGVVALLGRRIPAPLKLFLLSLAIVDDLGAILVIAVAYTDKISFSWLAAAAVTAAVIAILRRIRVWYTPVYVLLGLFLWLAAFESGVHATIAGVVLGLLTPVRPLQRDVETEAIVDTVENRPELSPDDVLAASELLRESVSVGERYERALHPWVSYVIVPVFALASAGIPLSTDAFDVTAPVFAGVVLGLVVGKPLGITLFAWVAVRLRLARLPEGVQWSNLLAVAAVAGIGFTVSLFITDLAFDVQAIKNEAKLAVLTASVVAALLGAALSLAAGRREQRAPGVVSAPGRPPR